MFGSLENKRCNILRFAVGVAFLTALGASTALAQTTGVSNFDIRIPVRPGNFGISKVTGVLTLNDNPGGGITIDVTNEDGVTCSMSASPGGATNTVVFDPANPLGATCVGSSPGGTADSASLVPPAGGLTPGDPAEFRYTLNMMTNSNLDKSVVGVCPDDSGTDDEWTISLTGASPEATGACLISFDQSTMAAECFTDQEIVSDDPTQVASVLISGTPTVEFCGGLRPATDVVLVLDRSGSMDNQTLGSAPRPKFSALRDAVGDFVNEWDALRTLEVSPPADQIGLVFFDTDEDVAVALGGFAANSGTVTTEVTNECAGTEPPNCSGWTSMGDGLQAAVGEFNFATDHRKVILLMSNGKQNEQTQVSVNNPANPTQVLVYETNPALTSPLFGAGQAAQIYTVTIGTSTAVSADINEDIARATGGFYVNSEDDAELLRPFFLELLENAVRFNTWQTLRLASGEATTAESQTVRFPVASTTRALTVNVMWSETQGDLRATLRPPGSSPVVATGSGSARISLRLPLTNPPAVANQDWELDIEVVETDPVTGGGTVATGPVPFNVMVQGDDIGLHSHLAIETADFHPGDDVVLTARIDEAGVPIEGLGSDPTAAVVATVLKPGVAIGDLLAASSASSEPAETEDAGSAADTKLENHLAKEPESLVTEESLVEFVDTGAGADATAGDGIYTGSFQVQEPGHYNVVFALEGGSERSGRFSRQRIESIHVRSVPDVDNTQVSSSTTLIGDGITQVVIDFTPLTLFGHHMVGFGPYFPVTASGHPTVFPVDNLDGTYTAKLNFSGEPPGDVTIHWVETSTVLDGITPDQLPVDLDDSTEFIPDVIDGVRSPWSFSVHLGFNDPRGTASSFLDGDFSYGVDLEYAFTPQWSLELYLGEDRFDVPAVSTDLDLFVFSLSGKYYFTPGSNRLFGTVGLGSYDPSLGSSELGFSLGLGGQFRLTPAIALEARATYHDVSSNPSFEYVQALAGVKLFF